LISSDIKIIIHIEIILVSSRPDFKTQTVNLQSVIYGMELRKVSSVPSIYQPTVEYSWHLDTVSPITNVWCYNS